MKRVLSFILAVLMCLSLLPLGALADEVEEVPAEEAVDAIEQTPEPAIEPEPEPEPAPEEEPAEELPAAEESAPAEEPVAEEESVVDAAAEEPLEEDELEELTADGAGETVVPGGASDNDALFGEYFEELLLDGAAGSSTSYANSHLSGIDLTTYSILRGYIAEVAAGTRSSTAFSIPMEELSDTVTWTADELGVSSIVVDDAISEDAIEAASSKVLCDLPNSLLVDALLADCPYELFWYDKTVSTRSSSIYFSASYSGGEWTLTITSDEVTYYFPVAEGYSAGDYVVDADKISSAQTAAANARSIVSQYASASDYNKLLGYKNEICALVSYNDAAAAGGVAFGDPWQAVYVFDGDSSTNVVCEGYAKAFKYLCDMTSFSSSQILCITVTGTMSGGTGEGPHMWNVVRMDDGLNYLVDVTNCDAGTVGYPDYLFLAGCASGNAEGGAFACGSDTITFLYDGSTTSYYASDRLTIAADGYSPSAPQEPEIIDSGACGDNVTWTLTDDGVLTISGTGAMKNYYYDDIGSGLAPWLGSGIKTVVIDYGVTSIGDYAFDSCSSLTSVTIPDSVTSIGDGAFRYCSSLTSVTIPGSVTSIGDGAFLDCSSLTSISVAEGNAYYSSKDGVLFNKSQTELVACPGGKSGSYTIPDGVTSIGEGAFYYCSSLTSVTIGNSVTSIGAYAFYGCSSLTSVTIPDGVTSIGEGAFSGCSSLTSVTIPSGVTSIGEGAFLDCYSLTSITIPDSVTSIGDWAFCGCSSLTSVTIPDSVTSIGNWAFSHCSSLTSITIPDSVTSIESYTFYYCSSLTSVMIPDSVTSIGVSAFSHCSSLTSITFLGNAPDIGFCAFEDVTATAYYPAGDATWTEDVMQDYGGTITWVAAGTHEHDYIGEITKEPTCTETGIMTYTCAGCGDTYTEEVAALGHDYATVVTAPTCTEQGYTTQTCTRCGDSYIDSYVDALGHTAGEAVHENETVATCEKTGSYDEVVYCTVCGAELSRETKTTPALGHDWNDGVVTKEPTCTEAGVKTYTCQNDVTHTYAEEIPALGHDWGEWTVTVPATEEAEGTEVRTCSRCGESESRAIPKLDHAHVLVKTAAKAATCTEAGNIAYWTCSGCGRLFSDAAGTTEITAEAAVIPALGHDYTVVVTAPTCTEKGYTTHTCSRCGNSYVDDYTDALGHDWGEWTVTIPATEEAEGVETRACTHCGETETRAIPKLEPEEPADGWVQIDGDWYFYENGTMVANAWKKYSVGWCYLGADGKMVTNTWQKDSKGWCYLGSDGRMYISKWLQDGGYWYYLNANGYMVTGWQKIGGEWYYFYSPSGKMAAKAWVKDSTGWLYMNASGKITKNAWAKDSVGWCYLGSDGYMVTSTWQKDSKGWCYLGSDGRMYISKWLKDGGAWYYLDDQGYMVTGWKQIGGVWYYFYGSGRMATGTVTIGGKTYNFDSSGRCLNP